MPSPRNFREKILRIGGSEKLSFLSQPFTFFFSRFFFCFIPMEISYKLCGRIDGTQFLWFWWFKAKNDPPQRLIMYEQISCSSWYTLGTVMVSYLTSFSIFDSYDSLSKQTKFHWNPKMPELPHSNYHLYAPSFSRDIYHLWTHWYANYENWRHILCEE